MNNTTNWNSSTWLETVQLWTNENLHKNGIIPIGDLQPVSGWALGQILKQGTNKGSVFFKATAFLPLFSNESELCHKLAELMPEYVPNTILSCHNRQWMITHDFGGGLPENSSSSVWAEAFKSFSQLQIKSIKHIDELSNSGCLVRSIDELPELLQQAFTDQQVISQLPDMLVSQRQLIVSNVSRAIEKLNSFNLPKTLVHGDLHIENIAKPDEKFIFFDWSDACISHPFIDGTYIYRMPESEDKQTIINAYLSAWTYIADMDELLDAWKYGELVCYAHQAISYASMVKSLSKLDFKDLNQAFLNAFNRLHN